MQVPVPSVEDGLNFATIESIKVGSQVRTMKGLVDRIWVTFRTRSQEKILASILVFPKSRSLEQLKKATVGVHEEFLNTSDLLGYECVIDVEYRFNVATYAYNAYVIGIYNSEDFREDFHQNE